MKINALVTGASRGIGRAIAKKLASSGYEVVGTFNSNESEANSLSKQYPNIRFVQADFSDRSSTLAFVEKMQGIDFNLIVNNAGVIDFETFDAFDISIWDRTMEINVTTPLLIATHLSGQIIKGGAIVNVASTDGLTGSFASMSYAASKAALINLTKSLGNNFGRLGIRVNAVAPGWINTGMSTDASLEAVTLTPLGRNGLPEEIADIVHFLGSENASFINGTTIIADGGYTNVDYIMNKEAAAVG